MKLFIAAGPRKAQQKAREHWQRVLDRERNRKVDWFTVSDLNRKERRRYRTHPHLLPLMIVREIR